MIPENPSFEQLRSRLRSQILSVTPGTFENIALQLFRFQAVYNPVYRSFLTHLGCNPLKIRELTDIPFLPIGLFKNHRIGTTDQVAPDVSTPDVSTPDVSTPDVSTPEAPVIFESSGTTGAVSSKHFVPDTALYETVAVRLFEQVYGPLSQYHILALLPSYLERKNASLVYMVSHFIRQSRSGHAGFFLDNLEAFNDRLLQLEKKADGKKVLVIGVTFALLDWAYTLPGDSFFRDFPNLVVMETGGMKGRRREMLREEVHQLLLEKLGVPAIHSEYGMTELLSQAYSQGGGLFRCAGTMKVLLRDTTDPFALYTAGAATGGINVIDLANLDSCAFIETQDLGKFGEEDDSFYVLGRFDNSDIRGCNLMVR